MVAPVSNVDCIPDKMCFVKLVYVWLIKYADAQPCSLQQCMFIQE